MKARSIVFNPHFLLFAALCMISALFSVGCSPETPEDQAKDVPSQTDTKDMANDILEQSGVKGGFIVHVNCGDGALTEALKKNDSYLVQGLDTNVDNVTKAREYISSKGKYGRVSVDSIAGSRFPYTDNMVNLIVAEDLGNISMDDAMRVLTPNGVLMTKKAGHWQKTVKPRPAEMDEWNQYLYDAGNNPVSKDSTISPIKHYQWVGSPTWGRHHDTTASLSALVSANGRIFYIIDEGPKESVQLPAENFLVARDAFNGTILWKKPIPEWQDHMFPMKSGPAYLPRRLVAVGDRVYVTLGISAPLSELDAVTGEVLRTFPATEETSEILLSDNTLFLVIGRPEKTDKKYTSTTTYVWDRAEEARTEWAWSKEPGQIMALDISSGKENWTKEYPVGPLSLSADANSVYFYDGSKLIGLDRASGKEKWQSDPIKTKKFDTAYAPRLVASDGVLIFSIGSQGGFGPGTMMAVSAENGKMLWEAPQPASGHYSPEDLFVIDGAVWSGNIAWGQADGKYVGRNIHTGELVKEFTCDADIYWFHQRCYPSKATEKYILPSRTGLEFVDLEEEHWDVNHYTRGGCFYGIMPSNGLVYTPPNACGCYLEAKLEGFGAMSGAFISEPDLKNESKTNRLEKGPAYNAAITDDSKVDDWPTYRHDVRRSGYTSSAVPSDVESKWKLKLGGKLSSPVFSGTRIYVAQVDAHTVYALDGNNGKVLWKYIAGGRVDSPPTVYQGRVLFGSADGYVYCLNSADGKLAWRFRAAPMDRRMMSYEQLESVWPVHGSVLIENDKIYCVAGRTVFLDGGMRLLQLNPKTGDMLSEIILDEIDPHTGKDIQFLSKSLDMPVGLNDILSSDGKYFYMRSQQFKLDGNRTFVGVRDVKDQTGEGSHVFSPIGFLDDSQFSRAYMMYGKSVKGGWGGWEIMAKVTPAGRLISVDENTVYGFGRKPEYYSESVVIDFHLYAAEMDGDRNSIDKITAPPKPPINAFDKGLFNYAGDWKLRQGIPRDEQTAVQFKWNIEDPSLQVRGMVVADRTMFVAGPPDIVSEEDAFFALDDQAVRQKLAEQSAMLKGKGGAIMWAVNAETGKKLAEYRMESLPVWDGMIAADGKLFLATMGGEVICYSGKGT